ncbi:MAG: formylmethanofuran dehydrogenase subunit C [Gammaproteobacteria bacterium]|nr:formylmethanofuran dehydrogenase subunit C [Gammaproteobacteria bacterium]
MTALTLTLSAAPDFDLDLAGVSPNGLQGLKADKVRRHRVPYGRRVVALGDFFEIDGSPDSGEIEIRNATAKLTRVGAGLAGGTIIVKGSTGNACGSEMRGGALRIQGSAGDYLGAAMRGGLIEVSGSVGAFAGGGLPGTTLGMKNGTMLIGGDAGDRLGDRMRRGLVVVSGAAGAYAGCNMLAGTLVLLGATGAGLGSGMRRGSILLAREPEMLLPTFTSTGTFNLAILPVLTRHLVSLKRSLKAKLEGFTEARRVVGDAACGGMGELLIAAPAAARRTRK